MLNRERAIVALMVGYMVVQILVPITQLPYPYLTPLGWKMFAYYGPLPTAFRVVHSDGRTEALTPADLFRMARALRPEVNQADAVPPVLCRQLPSISAVEFQSAPEREWRRFPCR